MEGGGGGVSIFLFHLFPPPPRETTDSGSLKIVFQRETENEKSPRDDFLSLLVCFTDSNERSERRQVKFNQPTNIFSQFDFFLQPIWIKHFQIQ